MEMIPGEASERGNPQDRVETRMLDSEAPGVLDFRPQHAVCDVHSSLPVLEILAR